MKNNFSIQDVRNFWNKVADIYDDVNEDIGEAHYQRYGEGLKYLQVKDRDKILNVWSRTGNAVPYLEKLGKVEIVNLEVSEEMIRIAKKKYPKANFNTTNLKTVPYSDNYFDWILSLETLEHTPDPEAWLKELWRVLKKGGRMVMSLPPQTAEWPLRIYELFFRNHGEGPHRFLASKEVKFLLQRAGFKLIEHKGTLLIPVGPKPLKNLGEAVIKQFPNSWISEMGIRQFYLVEKE